MRFVSTMAEGESFLYFAYGSNLSGKRINKNVPSAVFVCTARLAGYVLRYCEYSDSWKGAGATTQINISGQLDTPLLAGKARVLL